MNKQFAKTSKHQQHISDSSINIEMVNPHDKFYVFKQFWNFIPGVTCILLLASLITIIKPLLKDLGYVFGTVFAIIAPSGHLKTTLFNYYCLESSIFDDQILTFADRIDKRVIDSKISSLQGLCLLVDDIHEEHTPYAKKSQAHKADVVIRSGANSQDGAVVFITAESLTHMGIFSCIDRIFEIRIPEMNGDMLSKFKHGLSQLNPKHLNWIKNDLRTIVSQKKPEIEKFIQSYLSSMRYDSRKDYDLSLRLSRHHELIRLMNAIVWEFLFYGKEHIAEDQQLESALKNNRAKQEKELNCIRNRDRCNYIVTLHYILRDNIIKNSRDYFELSYDDSYTLRDGKIYITSTALTKGFSKYFGRYISCREVVKALDNEGLLEYDSENKKSVHIPGSKRRGYCIIYEFFIAYLRDEGIVTDDPEGGKDNDQ